MSASVGDATSVRKSLPLSEPELSQIERVRESATHREALSQLADVELTGSASEARLLRALVEAGLRAVREQVEASGYEQIAEQMNASQRRASARRRRPTWAHE